MTVNVHNFDTPGPGSTGPQQGVLLSQGGQGAANESREAPYVPPTWAGTYPPVDPQQPLCEYVSSRGTWTPPVYPAAAGAYQPVYPGQPTAPPTPYPGYGGVAPTYAYPGYYPWPLAPDQPKRDTYLLVVGIIAFAGSLLAILGGLASVGIMLLTIAIPSQRSTPDQLFANTILFLALAFVGLVGGGFCTYHSIRSLFLRKPSKNIWLPHFWIFLLCYFATLGLGYWLHTQGQSTTSPLLTGLLIYLSAALPALMVLALGLRRLRFSLVEQWSDFWRFVRRQPQRSATAEVSRHGQWPTSWRRLVLALVSGATLSVVLAGVLELIIQFILVGSRGGMVLQALNDPNFNPDPSLYGVLFLMLAVVAPIVEELVKPLAVVILIGRVRSKAEAFALGLACGIGFNLVETTGYISSGANDWLNVALIRSGAGLLHGFGAAMVALGWYILTHKDEGRWLRRLLLGFGCGLYAVFQHALWNGSWGLQLIPGPIGDFFTNWSWTVGTLTLSASELVNIGEMFGILIFFVYMAGRLRVRAKVQPLTSVGQRERIAQPSEGTYSA